MSSVFRDQTTGYWVIKSRVNGKDRRVKVRKVTQGEPSQPIPADILLAQAQHDESLCSKPSAEPPAPSALSTSLHTFITGFMLWYRRDRRRSTVLQMERFIKNFLHFLTLRGLENLESITPDVIDDYVSHRMAQGIKGYSALKEVSAISVIFSRAIARDIIVKNPCTLVIKDLRKRYPESQAVKYLEPKVVKKLLSALEQAIADKRIPLVYADLARVQLATGLRCTACCNLDFNWIDSNWIITVPPEWDKAKSGYRCCITDAGRAIIERRKLAHGPKGLVFPGTKVDHSWHWLKRVCKHYSVPIPDRFNHRLRHTLATTLVDHNIDLQIIGSQLGHHCTRTTQIYAKVREQAKVKAMKTICFD